MPSEPAKLFLVSRKNDPQLLQRLNENISKLAALQPADDTGLTVRVAEIDASGRVHFSVIKDREAIDVGAGKCPVSPSSSALPELTQLKRLAHALGNLVMSRADVYESMAKSLNCCPTLFRRRIRSQFAPRRKATLAFAYYGFQ